MDMGKSKDTAVSLISKLHKRFSYVTPYAQQPPLSRCLIVAVSWVQTSHRAACIPRADLCLFYPQTNRVTVLKQWNFHTAYCENYVTKGTILRREEVEPLFVCLFVCLFACLFLCLFVSFFVC